MRKWIGGVVLVAALAMRPALAAAQRRAAPETGPKHEFGVDLTFQYIDRGPVVTGGTSIGGGMQLVAPVDVRVGFLSKTDLMFEGRASLAWDSKGAGTSSTYDVGLGGNVLYRLKRGTGTHGLIHAPYFTGGVGLNFVGLGPGASATQFSLAAGVGTRVPYESAAVRIEGFLAYAFESLPLPHAFSIGTRIGLSFWH